MSGNWYMFVPRNVYESMTEEGAMGRAVGFSIHLPHEGFELFPFERNLNSRIETVSSPFSGGSRGSTRETAIEISIEELLRGGMVNASGERWYKFRGDFFGGFTINSTTHGGRPLLMHIFGNDSVIPLHSHSMPGSSTWQRPVSIYSGRNPIIRYEWFYIRITPGSTGHGNSYTFSLRHTLQRPNPTFSAFALGTNLFNLDGVSPRPDTRDANLSLQMYDSIRAQFNIINPAELFAHHMRGSYWEQNSVRVNRYGIGNNASFD